MSEAVIYPVIPAEMAPTVAQQVYVIASGIAQGAAGLLMASYLAKRTSVPTRIVISASLLSIALTFIPPLILSRGDSQ